MEGHQVDPRAGKKSIFNEEGHGRRFKAEIFSAGDEALRSSSRGASALARNSKIKSDRRGPRKASVGGGLCWGKNLA